MDRGETGGVGDLFMNPESTHYQLRASLTRKIMPSGLIYKQNLQSITAAEAPQFSKREGAPDMLLKQVYIPQGLNSSRDEPFRDF